MCVFGWRTLDLQIRHPFVFVLIGSHLLSALPSPTSGVVFRGTSEPEKCASLVRGLLRPGARCGPVACLALQQHEPPPSDVVFYGFSALFYIVNYLHSKV